MKDLKTYQYFLHDLIPLIKEHLTEIKRGKKDDYNKGKAFAYYDILSLIQMQAKDFGIDLQELGLENELLDELVY